MLRTSHGWGIAPSEFWGMTICEWFELAEHHASQRGIAGTSITEDRHEDLKEWAEKVRAERKAKDGTA